MKPEFMSFSKTFNDTVTDIYARPKVLTAVVALALSRQLPIPTSPTDDFSGYYSTQALPLVRELADRFNREMIVDVPGVLEQTRMFWNLRYNAAHPLISGFATSKYGFFDTIMGVGLFCDETIVCALNEHKEVILALAGIVAIMINDELTANPFSETVVRDGYGL